MKLYEYGELTQTKLLSFCGLNIVKHRSILDDMEKKGFIKKNIEKWGNKNITKYQSTEKGREFYKKILAPYEEMFPRKQAMEDREQC